MSPLINAFNHGHVKLMLPALERVLKMYTSLKSFTHSEDQCLVVLKTMFQDPLAEHWLASVHLNQTIFRDTIQRLKGQDCCAAIFRNVEANVTARCDDNFIPVLVRGRLREREENRVMSKESFIIKKKKTSKSFFATAHT